MADTQATNPTGELKPTLGLTGLTSNAMALIAPGAFLWLTFFIQSTTKNTGPAMWMGIVGALVLCLCTAICYSEMAKLYPGKAGSSYYFAEQAFLNREAAWRYARLSKFIVGWASHLYYWIYPGVMVGTMGILCGYVAGTIWPNFMSASNPGVLFMMTVAVVFAVAIAYIAHRGISSSTSANLVINIIQITALLIFAFFAIQYRAHHAPGSVAWQFDSTSGEAYQYEFKTSTTAAAGVSYRHHRPRRQRRSPAQTRCRRGSPCPSISTIRPQTPRATSSRTRQPSPSSVRTNGRGCSVQATIAILILVGFESVTAMGGEAKNAKRDIPIAVITSLVVQGCVFYFFEYFAANYFLNSGYTMQNAAGSAAPIGDMMVIVGDALFGVGHGRTFMLFEAATVFLALIGTTLSCMNTGARVTYAMGKDRELGGGFGSLHNKNLTPHRAIWTLAIISAVIGCVAVSLAFADGGAPTDAAIAALPHGIFSSFGYTTHDRMAALPNSLLTVTLASNFGTFVLYALSCALCMVAYYKHENFSLVRHMLIPVFGLLANLACMAFYIIGPLGGFGTPHEPLLALGIAGLWAVYGGIHFMQVGKVHGKPTLMQSRDSVA